jgi:hypothetical protein
MHQVTEPLEFLERSLDGAGRLAQLRRDRLLGARMPGSAAGGASHPQASAHDQAVQRGQLAAGDVLADAVGIGSK